MTKLSPRPVRRQGGVALLEALLAAVLLAIGLLGTLGLQARSYAALSEAGLRTEATMAAESLMGRMATDKARLGAYAFAGGTPSDELAPWYEETRTAIPDATIEITVAAAGAQVSDPREVVITISWTRQANTPTNKHTVRAYI